MRKSVKLPGSGIKHPDVIKRLMIAPCGMNCALCSAFLREKPSCAGCMTGAETMPRYCKVCIIRNCDRLKQSEKPYCFMCSRYPCRRLKQLDKRYRTKYGMSMIDNLENIRKSGIRSFVRSEKLRWACRECGGVVSVHRTNCLFCGCEKSLEQLSV